MKKIIVAIDGHSSCGKSTLANDISKERGYLYISSGSMYRAVTLYFLRNEIDIKDITQVNKALEKIDIQFKIINGITSTFLNDENVEDEIRGMAVSNAVSPVSAIPEVRTAMVAQQRIIGQDKGVVMDGRDIGTVVFKDAELKLFVTASADIRAKRRYQELVAKGMDVQLEEIQDNLKTRDHIDSTRATSPLVQAEDAVLIDNSNLSKAEQLSMVLALIDSRTSVVS